MVPGRSGAVEQAITEYHMIKPLRDILVLRPIGEAPNKVGKLWLPDLRTARTAGSGRLEVVAAGPKCLAVKAGDTVALKAYDGEYANEMLVEHEGEKLVVVRERDLIGVES